MEEWSLVFTFAALAGVLLTLFGAWWMVRVLRARRPGGDTRRDRSRRSDPLR